MWDETVSDMDLRSWEIFQMGNLDLGESKEELKENNWQRSEEG